MALIKFWICEQERRPRWVVRLDNEVYGDYLDKERALLDAIEAARDASAAGHEAEGLIDERSRVLTLVQRDEDRGVVSPAQYLSSLAARYEVARNGTTSPPPPRELPRR